MMSKATLSRLLMGASAVVLAAPAAARAQTQTPPSGTQVETLIVTATKRAEDIQDVPMSVSAISGSTLERAGIANFTEAARRIPSVQIVQSNNNRNSTVFIRGIGSSGTNPGIEASVGIFIDGVYMPAAGPIQSNLEDIAAIEVLRGPQGTLYGRNTAVGAINITTREPSSTFEALVKAGAGNFSEQHVSGYVGGPIADKLAGRLSFWENSHDGYERNLYDGSRTNDGAEWGFRGRLKWTPTDDLTVNGIGYYTNLFAHCCTAEPINPTGPGGVATPAFLAMAAAAGHPIVKLTDHDFTVDDETVGKDLTQIYGASVQADYNLGQGFTLTSITATDTFFDQIKALSADGLPLDVGGGPQPLLTRGYSEELRITSPAKGRLEYIGGLYLFRQTLKYRNGFTAHRDANRVFPGGLRITPGDTSVYAFDQTTDSGAIYGLTDAWRFTGGLRYSVDRKTAVTSTTDNPGASRIFQVAFPPHPPQDLSRRENKLTWTAGTQYDLQPGVMVYALAATGYKTGGFNARQTAPGTPLEFNAENSITYEAGVKSTLFDHRLVLNADVYRMLLKGFQESVLNPETGVGFIVGNAGDRRVDGIEADLRWAATDHLSVSASAAVNDAKFTNYTAGQCYTGKTPNGSKPGTCNYNGFRPAYSPAVQLSGAADWNAPLSGSLNGFADASVTYQSKEYLDVTLDPRSLQKAYTLVNLRAGVEAASGRWVLAVYGKNLGNEAYYTVTAPQPLSGLISGGTGFSAAQGFVGWYGPPRTYGIELTLKY
jgi:iron complex outermembrane receptor protein